MTDKYKNAILKIKAFSSMCEADQLAIISRHSAKTLKALVANIGPPSTVAAPATKKAADFLHQWGPAAAVSDV